MDSSNLLQGEHLSSVRRRNKILIIGFFSLIIVLALVTGGMIISLVQKINSESVVQKINSGSLDSNPAIREFCFTLDFPHSCITFLASEIKPPSNTNPNHIFRLSLEASLRKISDIISMVSNGTQLQHPFTNCSSSLGHATGQLSNILDIIRIDPDVVTYERGKITPWITAAEEDLAACVSDLGKAESTAADGVRTKVAETVALVGYSKDFLVNCDLVNQRFRWSFGNDRSLINDVVENLMTDRRRMERKIALWAHCFSRIQSTPSQIQGKDKQSKQIELSRKLRHWTPNNVPDKHGKYSY